jgi:hypothetical protein
VRELAAIALSIVFLGGAGCLLESGGSGPGALDASMSFDPSDAPPDASTPRDAAAAAIDASAPPRDAAVRADAGLPSGEPDAGRPLCSDDPALVACYPLDGDALDHGARGNHLQATAIDWDPRGGALLNADSKLFCPNGPGLSHAARTLLAWVRVDALASGRSGILDREREYGLFGYAGGELRCSMAIAAAGWVSAPGAFELGRWHHVACIAQTDRLELYVDGMLAASAPGAGSEPANATPLHLGADSPSGNDPLVGALDDVRIWDLAWTAGEVAADARRARGH